MNKTIPNNDSFEKKKTFDIYENKYYKSNCI